MLPITVLSDRPQTELLYRIARALDGTTGGFILREQTSRSPVFLERGVLVMRDVRKARRLALGEGVVAVLEPNCHAALKMAAERSMRPVCCGMSARDTLTAESISDGRALVCLQRAIPTVSGTDREPCQLVAITDGDCSASALLLTVGVLLAAGDERSEIKMDGYCQK